MSWIINNFKFNIYGIFIILSLIAGLLFNYIYLIKNKVNKRLILLSNLMLLFFCIMGAKYFTIIFNLDKNLNLLNAGFTSYGGMVGVICSSFLFYKFSKEKLIIRSNILSLPLIYSVSKLGCFFAGCCYGIPYKGIFSVTYLDTFNISLFPIQLLEAIVFFLIFIFGLLQDKNKKSIFQLVIVSAFFKFLLDYLRFYHIDKFISVNQILSLVVIIVTIIISLNKKMLD